MNPSAICDRAALCVQRNKIFFFTFIFFELSDTQYPLYFFCNWMTVTQFITISYGFSILWLITVFFPVIASGFLRGYYVRAFATTLLNGHQKSKEFEKGITR